MEPMSCISKQKIHFFAPLGNVDESILKLSLNEGFQINKMTYEEGGIFLSKLEKFPIENFGQWWHIHTVFSQSALFFIKNSFDFELPKNEDGNLVYTNELSRYANNFVGKNVVTPLILLRLFKEGDIHIPYWCLYSFKNEIPYIIYASGLLPSHFQNLFHLNEDEIKKVQEFLKTTDYPLRFDYIKLAHDNYELSYTIYDNSLSFLALMISLEILLKPRRNTRFSEEISRNVGTLLGNSQYSIEKIQRDISDLYTKRSELVHEGKIIWCPVGEDDDLTILRCYVRESLKKIIRMNHSKDDLLKYVNNPIGKNSVSR